jgi:threonine dehydrogenase-like Zn-dependent dehydrogenase
MRQLNYLKARTLEWHDVDPPELPSDEAALVRPLVVSTCDMDGVVIGGLAPFRGPLPVGHEGVAEVVAVGDRVQSLEPGDRVIVPWKISCGSCSKCQAGLTAHCQSVVPEAAYSWGPTAREWGGFLADLVAVPWAEHMLCPVPPGLDPLAASGLSDNITDAWRAVGPPLEERPGGSVLVAGGGGPGSIGLMSVGLARALGAGQIVYLDWDEGRRQIAAQNYQAAVVDTSGGVDADTAEGQFDVIVDASGNPEALSLVLHRTAPGAIVTSTAGAIYAFGDIPFPVFSMYRRGVTFHTGWVNTRPLMEKPLALISEGAFDPRVIETAVVSFDQAVEALSEPFTKLVLTAEPSR